MTREEQIDWLCRLRADLNNGIIFTPWNKEFTESLNNVLEQESCDDAISREDLLKKCVYAPIAPVIKGDDVHYEDVVFAKDIINAEPVYPKPKTVRCKDCKWWKDSDGLYRRGAHAESQCPINRIEVFEGNGYCYMFEQQESEGKE